jgi:hypothetical protein
MNNDDPLEWPKIIQAKRIKTSNQTVCGNVVAEYRDNIIIIEFEGKKPRFWFSNERWAADK